MGAASDFLNAKIGGESIQRVGIAGFTMLARVRESFTFSSEVPTTVLEDGSSVEDGIILNPNRLTIEGEVGDVYLEQTALQERQNQVASTAGNISIYLPERTQSQRQAIANINASINDALTVVDELISAGEQVGDLLGSANLSGKPLRERFVDTMESLHDGRQLVAIEMPYRTFENMRINNVDISRDNQRAVLGFKIEAIQIRVRDQAFSNVSDLISNPSAGLGGQAEDLADKGPQEGTEADTSLLGTIIGVFGG